MDVCHSEEEIHHCKLYNWLVQSNSIQSCQQQIDTSKVLQRIIVPVDTLALLEFDSYLGNCLVGNYLLFCKITQEVLFEVLKESVDTVNELSCVVRPSPALRIEKSELSSSVDSTVLVNYWARVVAVRDPVSYTQSTKYCCPVETCNGADDSSHIRVYTLKSRECDVINSNLQCTTCNERLYEDVSRRTIGRRMSIAVQLLRVEDEEESQRHYVDDTIDVVVRDELMSKVTLGGRVSIVGMQFTKMNYGSSTKRNVIEAVNIEQISSPLPHLIPRSVRDIYSVREQSPWQLLSLLAFCVTPPSCPQGSYHTLKQILLLSLIKTGPVRDPDSPLYLPTAHPEHSPALNILVQSADTLLVARLLTAMARLADVQCVKGCNSLCGVREGNTLHAGLLTTAADGVAMIGDVDIMRKEEKQQLSTTLQNRAAIVGKKKTEIFPLKCVVWGYQSDTVNKKQQQLRCPWDIVYKVPKDCDQEAVIESILEDNSESLLPDIDVKAYLALASTIHVKFDESCTKLISGYCLASKSVRYGSECELPPYASYSLHLLAGNHARINFRDYVLDVDAVAAIKLYEESLLSSQHYSSVDLKPSTHINPGEEDEYLGESIDSMMETFYTKLVQFCTTHIAGFTVDNED